MNKPPNAFILRQSPSGLSQLESISLTENVVVNGWSMVPGLIDEKDYDAFREILRKTLYAREKNLRKAGYAAGTMWRFINEMKIGDWVVVPYWRSVFYLAEITGEAFYDRSAAARKADSCYRRPVRWLNGKKPIERRFAKSKLISRMKIQGTSADAGDLVDEIFDALQIASTRQGKSGGSAFDQLFAEQLRLKMVATALDQMRHGYIDNIKFEQLVRSILLSNGATDAKIVPKLHDKGVDVLATFLVGGVSQVRVGVQVKHHEGETENKWIDQLIKGLEAENLSLGWFVTSGLFQKDAEDYLEKKLAGTALQVFLVDGEQLAGMIIDGGLETLTQMQGEGTSLSN
jgi:predicted Mrr-cat superfamily restriction endonuclease